MRVVARLAALGLVVVASSTAHAQFYQQNFSSNTNGFLVTGGAPGLVSTPSTCVTNGSAYCGTFLGVSTGPSTADPFSNHTAMLSLGGLTSHTGVTLSFSFFALHSWDGNAFGVGPDVFDVRLTGASTSLLNTTFSNVAGNNQSYPAATGLGNNAPQTGAAEANKLGFDFYGNAVYNFTLSFAHTGSTLGVDFTGSGLQGWSDEGWGLDDVSVSLTGTATSTPEPGTWALLASGLLGVAAARRRRRVPNA